MTKLKTLFCLLLLTLSTCAIAQTQPGAEPTVDMADKFYEEGKVYVVVVVASMVFIGMALYMFWLGKKLSSLEKKLENKN